MELSREMRRAIADEVKEAIERDAYRALDVDLFDVGQDTEISGVTVSIEGHSIIERAIERAWARHQGGRFAAAAASA